MLKNLCAAALALAVLSASGTSAVSAERADGLKKGDAKLESAGSLCFGPDGILFIADPWGAAVLALDTGEKSGSAKTTLQVENVDQKVAALLGTTAKEISIHDLAVNPASGSAYVSVARGRGPGARPVLVKIATDGSLSLVKLSGARFAKASIPNAPSPEAVGRRNAKLRLESITDIAFVDGRVLIAGLSNEEFASTLRSIPFPFTKSAMGTSVEIYHGAHGKFETRSPVRTFVPFDVAGEPHVLAAYTCTPLVRFPVKELKPGTHLKGTTIAELGNRNRPLDMIAYKKDGKQFLLLANSARGIMKIPTTTLGSTTPILARVKGKAGVEYETIADWKGVHQLDKLNDTHALVVVKVGEGYNLEAKPLP